MTSNMKRIEYVLQCWIYAAESANCSRQLWLIPRPPTKQKSFDDAACHARKEGKDHTGHASSNLRRESPHPKP